MNAARSPLDASTMMPATRHDLLVSVILPLHDDAAILHDVARETSEVLTAHFSHHEIILVAANSDVPTMAAAQGLLSEIENVRLIQLSRDFGREAALIAGLETSIGDYVVTLIPETDPPMAIPVMVAQCREAEGMVNGVDERGMSGGPFRLFLKRIFHAYMERFLKARLVPATTDFHVLSRRMVNALTQLSEGSRQLRMLSTTVGYQRRSFPYTPLARSGRGSRKSFWAELNMGIELLTSHSNRPLRWLSWIGWGASLLNLLSIFYTITVYLCKSDVAPGWTTLSLLHGVMFFLLFSILATLCEYVGRIVEQTRGRPLYFIGDEKTSSVLHLDSGQRNIVNESK
jgi:polyisoprenyl-phosphate glycosyltransferase